MRGVVMRALLACAVATWTATAHAQSSPDRQFWTDFVPSWRVRDRATDELEFSFRTAWQGDAPTSYWATNTLEWNARTWLGLNAIGALVESRGPAHGAGYFEMRPSVGVRLTWRGTRVRASEFLRAEHRFIRPLGGATVVQERLRHREQVQVALNHASLAAPRTFFLIADAEWFFVHGATDGWVSNQLRVRSGLGLRWNARRSFEVILNDTRRRGETSLEFEDADHVLRLRWRELLGGH